MKSGIYLITILGVIGINDGTNDPEFIIMNMGYDLSGADTFNEFDFKGKHFPKINSQEILIRDSNVIETHDINISINTWNIPDIIQMMKRYFKSTGLIRLIDGKELRICMIVTKIERHEIIDISLETGTLLDAGYNPNRGDGLVFFITKDSNFFGGNGFYEMDKNILKYYQFNPLFFVDAR